MAEATLLDRFQMLRAALESEHFERSEEIECALLSLVAGCTFFMVGEPGLAKSMLARRIAVRISDAEFFDQDLDRFSTPDDLFGPRSLAALKEDRWERAVEGTLLTAHFAMLDELFEANSALLKALHRTLNEGTYRNGSEIIELRLSTVFSASNEVPADPRLAALFDRLLIRRVMKRIVDIGSFTSMLTMERDPKPPALLSWSDVVRAQGEATRVRLTDKVLTAVAAIRSGLAAEGVLPSDRRFVEAMRVVRAAAWLDGCTTALPEHLRCLHDILWARTADIGTVERVVDGVLEPLVSKADELLRAVAELRREVRPDLEELERKQLALELNERLKRAKQELEALTAEWGDKRTARQDKKLQRISESIREASIMIMRDLFKIDPVP